MHAEAGPKDVGGAGVAPKSIDHWTWDVNLIGSGEAYFVVSNVAEKPAESKLIKSNMLAGSLEAKNTETGKHMEPSDTGGDTEPVVNGQSLVNRRVHSMVGANDRALFDGRSVFGDIGVGFLEGMVGGGGAAADPGVFTLIRGGDYWVGFAGPAPGQPVFEDTASIIKDPKRLESGNPFGGMIMTAGMMGMEGAGDCGYDAAAKVKVIEQREEVLRFTVSGDLFDMQSAMGLGDAPTCHVLKVAWIERATFEVTLPYGRFHAGDSQVKRLTPPGQEVYDETDFLDGANFGGVETSRSLSGGDETDNPQPAPPNPPPTGAPAGPSAIAAVLNACSYACPDVAEPPTPACRAHCVRQFASCGPATAASPKSSAVASVERRTPSVAAQRKWLARLVDRQDLPPEISEMLVEDFVTMSDETRALVMRRYRNNVE